MHRHLSLLRQQDLTDQIVAFGNPIAKLAADPTLPCKVPTIRASQVGLHRYFKLFHARNRDFLRRAGRREAI